MLRLFKSVAGVSVPVLALLALTGVPGQAAGGPGSRLIHAEGSVSASHGHPEPHVLSMRRAGSKVFDVRHLPQIRPPRRELPEREEPANPNAGAPASGGGEATVPSSAAPAPAPSSSFDGLDFANWGAGHPPDPNGDVGPAYYMQTVNTSIGIYDKGTHARVAAFTYDTFMSQGSFGNLCDTDNYGDPVVLYDSFEDRWVVTDFAFQLDGSGNVVNPPGSFECIAVSKTGDPVSGGWNFYSINTTGGMGDYPKLGIWPDGIYMSVNMFDYAASGSYQDPRVYAFDKMQMYAGAPTVQVVSFDAPPDDFTLLPSNARLQTGTPPAGTPDYFISTWEYTNALTVYKFHVDWTRLSLSTFTGPDTPHAPTSWSEPPGDVPSGSGGNTLDTLADRAMVQNQYSNIGGAESLWVTHTVAGSSSSQSAVRYYQVNVTGGSVASNVVEAATYNPDTTTDRYMPSVAVDRVGDMAIGYSRSGSSLYPEIEYAGRLSGDAANSITQTERTLIAGAGSQVGSCGGTCHRWGDYSAMTLDPNGCTFWYTNEYYAAASGPTNLDWLTRIGSFSFPSCTTVGSGGTISGTVTALSGGSPIGGALVALGSRTATTANDGTYSFSVPAGTYPSLTASSPGYVTGSYVSIPVTDSGTATRDFALATAPGSGSFVDTTQADFQTGVPSKVDLTTSPGNVTLPKPTLDQQNTTVTNNGFGFTSTSWAGQTFTPAVSGQLTRVDLDLFCSSCTGTTPNLTVSIRATTGSPAVPTGGDLATTTIPGFSSGSGGYFTADFSGSPPSLTAGTRYAVVIRAISNPSAGIYAYVCSCSSNSNPYTRGQRVTSSTSGSTWSADTTSGGRDLGFKVYMNVYGSPGSLVSSVKDANPAPGHTPTWGTLSWTASTPAGTSITFQAAAGNSPYGPFTFVGPDGTSGTTFSNGGSLSEFNGMRYLKWKATLSTSNSANTPTLNDVTVTFTTPVSALSTSLAPSTALGTYGGTVNLSATLTHSSTGVSGKSVSFTLNGTSVGSATTNGSGVATLNGASLSGINAGTYVTGVGASFAGDVSYASSGGTAQLSVSKADQTITFGAIADHTYGDADFSISPSASSGLTVSLAVGLGDQCTIVSGPKVHITGAGSCTVTASQAGNTNYNPAPSVPQTFSIAKAEQTITFAAIAGHRYGDADFSISPSASSGLTVSLAVGLGDQCTIVTGPKIHITGVGSCTVTASQAGDSNYNPATDVARLFTISKGNQTISFPAIATHTYGNPDFTISATASSGLPVSFARLSGPCTVSGTTVHITGAGSCTIEASQAGGTNWNAATPVDRTFTIAKANQTITFPAIPRHHRGDPNFRLHATSTSHLAIRYRHVSGPCTVTLGGLVHITGRGICTIKAKQPGNANYNAARPVSRSFRIV